MLRESCLHKVIDSIHVVILDCAPSGYEDFQALVVVSYSELDPGFSVERQASTERAARTGTFLRPMKDLLPRYDPFEVRHHTREWRKL